ncbi:hypothetical protein KFK09_028768 [Dendrobium nobile]|uniref:Uncharacterized protein n=1 Tax=Dendrobium nobile TaxID=94219 RepID=A0A8T3A476_DENNO|nr:hypothetical protein KFK09_028768 [Dendrobium nobile]
MTGPHACAVVEPSKEQLVEELLFIPSNPPLEEPLLAPNPNHFCMFLIRYPHIWEMYEKVEASFWITKEVNLCQDIYHWDQTLKSDECHFMTHVLTFFTVADGIIIENLAGRIQTKVSLLDSKLADGTILICGVAQTMHAMGKKMAFLVLSSLLRSSKYAT